MRGMSGTSSLYEQVRQAIDGDGLQARIAEDHFVQRLAGRVAVVGRADVGGQQRADRRDLLQEGHRLGLAEGLEVGLLLRPAGERLARLVPQGPGDLLRQLIVQAVDQVAHVVGDVAQVQPVAPPVAGKDDVFQALQDLDDRFVAGQRAMPEMGDRAQFRVGLDNPVGQFGQGLFDANVGRHGMTPEGYYVQRARSSGSGTTRRRGRKQVDQKRGRGRESAGCPAFKPDRYTRSGKAGTIRRSAEVTTLSFRTMGHSSHNPAHLVRWGKRAHFILGAMIVRIKRLSIDFDPGTGKVH